jgi:hypothetical protein
MSNREMLLAAMRARIDYLKSSLRYSHGLDRSDVLADLANCEALLERFRAGLPLGNLRPIGATLH